MAIEAAWADHSVQQSAEMARLGGRLVLVGISEDDRVVFKHSTVRRKGLTIKLVRRMKHTYPRAIRLVEHGLVDFRSLVTRRFKLSESAEAFSVAQQREGIKVIIEP